MSEAIPTKRPPRSITHLMQLRHLPAELTDRNNWVGWRYEWRLDKKGKGYWTKIPKQMNHANVDPAGPRTWTDFSTAFEAYLNDEFFDGIGSVFSADDPYVGIDLDKSLDAAGALKPWAMAIYSKVADAAYAEISPSGTGIKMWVKGGRLPNGKGRTKSGMGEDKTGKIEVYSEKRFFTITGNVFGRAA